MKIEVEELSKVNKLAEKKCQIEFVPKSTLPQRFRPFGTGVLGYKVRGIKNHPECRWMTMQEPIFVDKIRKSQNERALKLLNSIKSNQK